MSWIESKIKGLIAETACREHFTAIGYTVEPLGVEHVAPAYLALHKAHMHDLPKYCREELHTLPDFIASRRNADGVIQVLFVEVKYRSHADLDQLHEKLYKRYGRIAERGADLVFYLVAREAQLDGRAAAGHLFLNCSWNRGWRTPELTADDARVQSNHQSFVGVYTEVIRPALQNILSGKPERELDEMPKSQV